MEKRATQTKKKEKVCDNYCRNCIYCQAVSGVIMICCYYLETDKRRPCDPGKGCTVKKKRKRKLKMPKDYKRGAEDGK